jgi:hypothetical protein
MWGINEDEISPVAMYSLIADPLPPPSQSIFNNKIATHTICHHPELFKIVCNINIDAFEALLADHPCPLFVDSVIFSLCYGFWPLAEVPGDYLETCDNPFHEPNTKTVCDFLKTQIHKEEVAGRFSHLFSPNLLPEMYTPPIHTV